eukprot:m.53407 g.53407  ORF g.53407 m.53407 type:complete len:63 (-) comp9153_c0_seq2:1116-1304(-)
MVGIFISGRGDFDASGCPSTFAQGDNGERVVGVSLSPCHPLHERHTRLQARNEYLHSVVGLS